MDFGQKIFFVKLIYLFSRVFWLGLFKIFWLTVQENNQTNISQKPISSKKTRNFNFCKKYKKDLKFHISQNLYECKICSNAENFANFNSLKEHLISVHEGPNKFSCKICNRKFSRNDRLSNHLSLVHERKNR